MLTSLHHWRGSDLSEKIIESYIKLYGIVKYMLRWTLVFLMKNTRFFVSP